MCGGESVAALGTRPTNSNSRVKARYREGLRICHMKSPKKISVARRAKERVKLYGISSF